MNVVLLEGTLSTPAKAKELPSGSVVWALEVTTRNGAGEAMSVPVEWFDPVAEPSWEAGVEVVVLGAVRRRFYRAGTVTQSRTTVVAEQVALASDRRSASRLRRRLERLGTGGGG
jgi:single-strand DNA-binding protein